MLVLTRFSWLLLLVVPSAQWAFERFAPLPVAPSRTLAIALCLLALAPIAIDLAERRQRRRLSRRGRALLALASPLLALALLLGAVRLSGGPWGPISGGRLRGTPGREAAPDWAQSDSVRYVAIELAGGRSLETLVIREASDVYVGANYPELKRWPHEVRAEPEIVLRVGDVLYPRRAVFIEDAAHTARLLRAMNTKYGFDVSMGTGRIWVFRLDPR